MPELNKANRQTCDVDIRILSTKAPFLFFDTANTTTTGISADNVYAMAKGARKITFQNPITGTMKIEAQVYPFKFFSLFSDGEIQSSAAYAVTKTVTCAAAGTLALTAPAGQEIKTGTVFVYPEDSYGEADAQIEGTFAEGTFTATTAADIAKDAKYKVGYIVTRTTGVKKIEFNNKRIPKDYYITQTTLDKDEDGVYTPFVMTAYKATIQRNFELSFNSEGDPASVSMSFDLSEDKEGRVLDMVELTGDAY